MSEGIQIIEKPDWVSWDDIKRCLNDAHAINRAKGINMTHYQWPADKIRDSLGENGVMLVALDGGKVVATAAIAEKKGKVWYTTDSYAYLCFVGVHPSYSGKGLYHSLTKKIEEIARLKGLKVLVFDTHKNNKIMQNASKKNGYRFVRFFQASSRDHYSVVMAKWMDGCPYSRVYCWWNYYCSLIKVKVFSLYSILNR